MADDNTDDDSSSNNNNDHEVVSTHLEVYISMTLQRSGSLL